MAAVVVPPLFFLAPHASNGSRAASALRATLRRPTRHHYYAALPLLPPRQLQSIHLHNAAPQLPLRGSYSLLVGRPLSFYCLELYLDASWTIGSSCASVSLLLHERRGLCSVQ